MAAQPHDTPAIKCSIVPRFAKCVSMLPQFPFPIRNECPPGTCICGRDELLNNPNGDIRVLRLTSMEERKLIERIENISSYDDLKHVAERLRAQLGIVLTILPGPNEVRTVRGFIIRLEEQPGLCRKLRQSIPAAVRRCLERKPEIAYAILDAHDLFGTG
jgi:hypothetical protein